MPNRADLADFAYVLAIARHRNFRLAGLDMGVSASALSHSLKALEGRLGVRLFNRTNRSVTLTAAGEELLAAINEPIAAIGPSPPTIDVSSFCPISPAAAIQILDAASVGTGQKRLLADLAMAGVIKGYARLIESDVPAGNRHEVRDSRIDRAIWRRIVAEDKVPDFFAAGSVHLGGQAYGERISVIGIRFCAASVAVAASDHGIVRPELVTTVKATQAKMSHAQQVLPLGSPASVEAEDQPSNDPVVASSCLVPRRPLDPNTVALSKDEAAAVLGVSLGTVNNLIKRERLAAKKVGRRVLVQADSVRALMAT